MEAYGSRPNKRNRETIQVNNSSNDDKNEVDVVLTG